MGSNGSGAQEWHREVLETAPVPVAVYDSERVIRYVNEAAIEFIEADDASDIVGRRAAEFVHPDDREKLGQRIVSVLEERNPVKPLEHRFVTLQGNLRYAVTAGAPVTFQGTPAGQAILNDVTEQKRREDQLRRERDRFELLFDNLPSPVVYGHAEDNQPIVRAVNQRFVDVFGYEREEVEGENLDEYIVPPDRKQSAQALNEEILAEGRLQTEVRRETRTGERDFLLTIVLEELDDETPEGYAIYTNVSEKKDAERELERQKERLEEFSSVLAHDLRNPLSIAQGSIELANESGEPEHFERAEVALDRMEELIDGLLRLAKQGETIDEIEPVGLESLANRAWETVETGEADITVEDSVSILADGQRLQELLENLFRNAVEHGGEGVTVALGPTAEGFYVADSGHGIPPDEREKIFESGYSSDSESTGLGLAVVNRIAEGHGWEVEVTASESGGARFDFVGVSRPK